MYTRTPSRLRAGIVFWTFLGAACGDAERTSADAPDVVDAVDAVDANDALETAAETTAETSNDTQEVDGQETSGGWPWPLEAVSIPPSDAWKARIGFPSEAFRSADLTRLGQPRWVKFLVLTGDPTRIYFQDSTRYPFHFDFAHAHAPQFATLTRAEFDRLSLHADGQKAILGSILYAPPALGAPAESAPREVGIQLIGEDAYSPAVALVVLALVRDAVDVTDAGVPPQTFYMPTFSQEPSATAAADTFAAAGFPLASTARWASGDQCYAPGWAIGKLVHVPAAGIDAAYANGTLGPEDILLTDGVPAEVPHVAGIVSLVPGTPSSHVAVLAATFGTPFVWIASSEGQTEALALAGKLVVLRAADGYQGCRVDLTDVDGLLSPTELASLRALAAPAPLDFPPVTATGALARDASLLTDADTAHFGGKASHFGILRRAIPEASPSPAIGLSFDLFTAFMAQTVPGSSLTLRETITAKLAAHQWPPDIAQLKADLAEVRALVRATPLADARRTEVLAALAPFETPPGAAPARIRFRSSTNVEDGATFTGAGLYDSYSGCLPDDTDGDAVGPSACDPSEPDERGVFRAIGKVFASLWNDNAYLERLRRAAREADVGMALLVHASTPDEVELANGVAIVDDTGTSQHITLTTQLGAESVTNPSSSAQPEIVKMDVYGFGTYPSDVQPSSLAVLGAHVMTWEDDYRALTALLVRVSNAWKQELPGDPKPLLDLEFKKVADAAGGHLVVKQVRAFPRRSSVRNQVPFLLPRAAPLRLCTFQGEAGSLMGNHRAKVIVTLDNRATWLDASGVATTLYGEVSIDSLGDDGELQHLTGLMSGLPGAKHVPPDDLSSETYEAARDTWTTGTGPGLRTVELATQFRWKLAAFESPLVTIEDASVSLTVTYPTERPDPDAWQNAMTLTDRTPLGPCPDETVVTPPHRPTSKQATLAGGVTIDIAFWYPPMPLGDSAGYTAPLARWDRTIITGLTSAPITLTGYWSQTFRPGHHNFDESFLFEPRLDPSVPAALLAELASKNIAGIFLRVPDGDALVLEPAGTFRAWADR